MGEHHGYLIRQSALQAEYFARILLALHICTRSTTNEVLLGRSTSPSPSPSLILVCQCVATVIHEFNSRPFPPTSPCCFWGHATLGRACCVVVGTSRLLGLSQVYWIGSATEGLESAYDLQYRRAYSS